jgi:hypothetical protein
MRGPADHASGGSPLTPRKENAMSLLSMRLPNEKHVSSVSHDPRVLRSVNASGLERLTAAIARKARAPLRELVDDVRQVSISVAAAADRLRRSADHPCPVRRAFLRVRLGRCPSGGGLRGRGGGWMETRRGFSRRRPSAVVALAWFRTGKRHRRKQERPLRRIAEPDSAWSASISGSARSRRTAQA